MDWKPPFHLGPTLSLSLSRFMRDSFLSFRDVSFNSSLTVCLLKKRPDVQNDLKKFKERMSCYLVALIMKCCSLPVSISVPISTHCSAAEFSEHFPLFIQQFLVRRLTPNEKHAENTIPSASLINGFVITRDQEVFIVR